MNQFQKMRQWVLGNLLTLTTLAGVVTLVIAGQQRVPSELLLVSGWLVFSVAILARLSRLHESHPLRISLLLGGMIVAGAGSASSIVGKHFKELLSKPTFDALANLASDRVVLVSSIIFLLIYMGLKSTNAADRQSADARRIDDLVKRVDALKLEIRDRPNATPMQAAQLKLIDILDDAIFDTAMMWVSSAKEGATNAADHMEKYMDGWSDQYTIAARRWVLHSLDHSKISTEQRSSHMADALRRARQAIAFDLYSSFGIALAKPNLTLPENMPKKIMIQQPSN
jgi:hypothetical protein